jgi:hypothetical protein
MDGLGGTGSAHRVGQSFGLIRGYFKHLLTTAFQLALTAFQNRDDAAAFAAFVDI